MPTKSILLALCGMLSLPALSAELDPAVFRLFPLDAQVAFGVDALRQAESPLDKLFPLPSDLSQLEHYIRVEKSTATEYWVLEIQSGTFDPLPSAEAPTDAGEAMAYRGVPLAEISWGVAAQITPNLRIVSSGEQVRAAIDRWQEAIPLAPFAESAARASMDFDDWIVIDHPVDMLRDSGGMSFLPKVVNSALDRITTGTGGVRFGPVNELFAALTTSSDAEAAAIAALGKLLPDLLRVSVDPGFVPLIDIAQEFETHASGSTATASAILPSELVDQLVQEIRKR